MGRGTASRQRHPSCSSSTSRMASRCPHTTSPLVGKTRRELVGDDPSGSSWLLMAASSFQTTKPDISTELAPHHRRRVHNVGSGRGPSTASRMSEEGAYGQRL